MEYLIIFVMIILTIKHFFLGGVSDGEGLLMGFSAIGSIWAFMSLKEKNAIESIKNKKNEIEWNRVLEKNSFVQEIADEINSKYIRHICIYTGHLTLGEKEVIYSRRNLSDFSNERECLYLAQNIKNKLKHKNIYEIYPIYEEFRGYSSTYSSTLIGFKQTYNGDFAAIYSDDNTHEVVIGYELVARANAQKSNSKRENPIKSWKC